MYNRYIPQSDGTYRRSRVQEPQQRPPERRPPPPKPTPEQSEKCNMPGKQEDFSCLPQQQERPCRPRQPEHRGESVSSFLGQLLPKDFDTGDLIVVLLLLLLAGDCEEDRSTALLTLALYFIM